MRLFPPWSLSEGYLHVFIFFFSIYSERDNTPWLLLTNIPDQFIMGFYILLICLHHNIPPHDHNNVPNLDPLVTSSQTALIGRPSSHYLCNHRSSVHFDLQIFGNLWNERLNGRANPGIGHISLSKLIRESTVLPY